MIVTEPEKMLDEIKELSLDSEEELSRARRIWYFHCKECGRIQYKERDIRYLAPGKYEQIYKNCYHCGKPLDYENDIVGDSQGFQEGKWPNPDYPLHARIEGKTSRGKPNVQAYIWTECVHCHEYHMLPLNMNGKGRIKYEACKCAPKTAERELQELREMLASRPTTPVVVEPYGKELEPVEEVVKTMTPEVAADSYICQLPLANGKTCGQIVKRRGKNVHEIHKHGRKIVSKSYKFEYREPASERAPSITEKLVEPETPKALAPSDRMPEAMVAAGVERLEVNLPSDLYTKVAVHVMQKHLDIDKICAKALKAYLEGNH